MTALHQLSACDAAAQLEQRTLRAEDLVRACIEHIDAREPEVQAWAYLQRDVAIAHAKQLDTGAHRGLCMGCRLASKICWPRRICLLPMARASMPITALDLTRHASQLRVNKALWC